MKEQKLNELNEKFKEVFGRSLVIMTMISGIIMISGAINYNSIELVIGTIVLVISFIVAYIVATVKEKLFESFKEIIEE